MNKTALIESLMSTFVEEVADHVRSFNSDLLALESGQGDSENLLRSLFRTAHNLKGASRAVDVGLVESAWHGLGTARAHSTATTSRSCSRPRMRSRRRGPASGKSSPSRPPPCPR